MKKYYVYELINFMGTFEYVGETYRPKFRMNSHTKIKPSTTGKNREGKFYGRQDLIMNIVSEFDNRKDALELEGKLKLSHGMQWTERNQNVERPVIVYKKDGSIVGIYQNLLRASKELGLNNSHASKALRGLLKTTNGYIIKKYTK
jgi:hypothetical protein